MFVLTLTPPFSDFSDPSSDCFSYSYIAKWTEDIPVPAISGEDLFFSSEFQDMHGSDAFELKDTASVHSMDSAYQSQSSGASRRGAPAAQGFQPMPAQDSRTLMANQFMGSSSIYSPSMSSDNITGFADPQDMNQMHLPAAAGDMEAGERAFAYANLSTGQDYSHHSTNNVSRVASGNAINLGYAWSPADTQLFSGAYGYPSYPNSTQGMDPTLYSSQDTTELMYTAPAQPQRPPNRPRIDTSGRPAATRNPPSFAASHDSRRASMNDASYGAMVMSPTSAVDVHIAQTSELGQQHLVEPR